MNGAKIMKNIEFGSGQTSVLFDLVSNKTYIYENEPEKVHELYGGRQYYSSRSGASGAGFIENNNNLLILDSSRSDCYDQKYWNEVDCLKIMILWDRSALTGVLIKKDETYFFEKYDYVESLKLIASNARSNETEYMAVSGYTKEGKTTISLPIKSDYEVPRDLKEHIIEACFLNDIKPFTEFWELISAEDNSFNKTHFAGVTKYREHEGKFYHSRKVAGMRVIDQVIESDPREFDFTSGFSKYQQGENPAMWYKQNRSGNIYAFTENDTTEYEQEFELFDFLTDVDKSYNDLLNKLRYKTRKDFLFKRKRELFSDAEKIQVLLKDNADLIATVNDSYAVGNCEMGTDGFLKRFNFENEVKLGDLVNHPKWSEIAQNSAFQNAIMAALDRLGIVGIASGLPL